MYGIFYKRICRVAGIPADLYELPENAYGDSKNNADNACYDTSEYDAIKGLQNISPCQYSKCILFSYHTANRWFTCDCCCVSRCTGLHIESSFLPIGSQFVGRRRRIKAEQKHSWNLFQNSTGKLIEEIDLRLDWIISLLCYSILSQKLGVPVEGKVRVQLNLRVQQTKYIVSLKNFRSIMFPIIWVEEVRTFHRQLFMFSNIIILTGIDSIAGCCRIDSIHSSLDLFGHRIRTGIVAHHVVQHDSGRFIYADVRFRSRLQKFRFQFGSDRRNTGDGSSLDSSRQQLSHPASTPHHDASPPTRQLHTTKSEQQQRNWPVAVNTILSIAPKANIV